MARVLIVACGCRGRELARTLIADGHAVRGTTRDPARLAEIEATGAEAALADPDRLATLLPALTGVGCVCWLLGSATGEADSVAALHDARLASLLERLVDTPVRGVVYEAQGTVPTEQLARGAALARAAATRSRLPVEIVDENLAGGGSWLAATAAAVRRLLTPET